MYFRHDEENGSFIISGDNDRSISFGPEVVGGGRGFSRIFQALYPLNLFPQRDFLFYLT